MKIAVVNNCIPFISGGAEYLANALVSKLNESGHSATLVRIPFRWEPPSAIVESMLAARLAKIPNADRVIALKFPAYYVPHANKVLWLLHQFRQAYDLWGTPWQGLPDTAEGLRVREVIHRADNEYLPETVKIWTNSKVTSDRLKKFNGLNSEVLWPPLLTTAHLSCRDYGDFIFYPSRVTESKRQHLLIESMKYVKSAARLVIAGKEEHPTDLARLQQIVRDHQLEQRVELLSSFITEDHKADLFSRCLGCAYIPYDEDSYGYVTLESYESRKPVITCSDSGGTNVVVKDGQTGFVVAPDPMAIADAIDRLYQDKQNTRRMGEQGLRLIHSLGISWEHVIKRLTE